MCSTARPTSCSAATPRALGVDQPRDRRPRRLSRGRSDRRPVHGAHRPERATQVGQALPQVPPRAQRPAARSRLLGDVVAGHGRARRDPREPHRSSGRRVGLRGHHASHDGHGCVLRIGVERRWTDAARAGAAARGGERGGLPASPPVRGRGHDGPRSRHAQGEGPRGRRAARPRWRAGRDRQGGEEHRFAQGPGRAAQRSEGAERRAAEASRSGDRAAVAARQGSRGRGAAQEDRAARERPSTARES